MPQATATAPAARSSAPGSSANTIDADPMITGGALYALRRTLATSPTEGSRYLASEDESLVLCPGGQLWVDVDAFEEAAATARRVKDLAAYRVAIDLYAGELLPGDRYEEWAQERREGLRTSYLGLLM